MGLLAVLSLVLSSCSYRAGSKAAEDFDEWVKEHPIRGAEVDEALGNNVYPFKGELTVYIRLTVEPSDSAIVTAMRDVCRFDDETRADVTYWLQVERVSIQASCTSSVQPVLATFYDAVAGLDGLDSLFLWTAGVEGHATDEAVPLIAGPVFAAADATGYVAKGSPYTFDSKHVSVIAQPGQDLAGPLATAHDVLPVVGHNVTKLKVTLGLVATETSGTVAEAQGWQAAVTPASGTALAIVPRHVVTDVAYSDASRDLVERLSTKPGVDEVATYPDHWQITLADSATAHTLQTPLATEPGRAALGKLILAIEAKYRFCGVSAEFPVTGRAEALLGLCERKDVPRLDDRFTPLGLQFTGSDFRPILDVVHQLKAGTAVYLQCIGQGADAPDRHGLVHHRSEADLRPAHQAGRRHECLLGDPRSPRVTQLSCGA